MCQSIRTRVIKAKKKYLRRWNTNDACRARRVARSRRAIVLARIASGISFCADMTDPFSSSYSELTVVRSGCGQTQVWSIRYPPAIVERSTYDSSNAGPRRDNIL